MNHAAKLLLPTFALTLLLAWVGPTLLDKSHEYADDLNAEQERHAAAQREKRKERAAREMCGNGALIWHDDVSMSCINRITEKEGAKNAL